MADLLLRIQASSTKFGGSNLFMMGNTSTLFTSLFSVFKHPEKAEKDKERKKNERKNTA